MREIKFRGFNISRHTWVYGCLVNNLWTYSDATDKEGRPVCEIVVTGEAEDWSQAEDELITTVDESTVGQFTGLTDKNGKDIYDGDIIKMNGGAKDIFFSVDFEDGCFVAKVPWKKDNWPELKYYIGWKEEIIVCEIIGNIYENNELLKP